MTFDYLIKSCEIESERVEEQNFIYLDMILNKLMQYIDKQVEENPDMTMKDINDKVTYMVKDYLSSMSESNVLNKTIEHYLNTGSYSGKTDIRKVYDKIYKEDRAGKINIASINEENLRYTYNMQENMEILTKFMIKDIRKQKEEYKKMKI